MTRIPYRFNEALGKLQTNMEAFLTITNILNIMNYPSTQDSLYLHKSYLIIFLKL